MPHTIQPRSLVRLHLAIHLADGTEALSTFGEEPLEVTIGDDTLPPALEAQLTGLEAGAEQEFVADGTALYGERDPERIHWLPQADFPPQIGPEPGQVVAFEAPDGEETAGIVLEVTGEHVCVDFNHPLAGRTLQIRVRILDVATPPQGEPNP